MARGAPKGGCHLAVPTPNLQIEIKKKKKL